LRAALRYPRAGLAVVYSTFERIRERRLQANAHLRRHDASAVGPAPIVVRDGPKAVQDQRRID
jgi:hypothetical protein